MMEEEKIAIEELDTTEEEEEEVADVVGDVETPLLPEDTARQLFASYLEPDEGEGRPEPEEDAEEEPDLGKQIDEFDPSMLVADGALEDEELDDEEVEGGLKEMSENFNQPLEEIKKYYDQNPDKLQYFKHTLLEKKAIKLIIDSSSIKDVKPEAPEKDRPKKQSNKKKK